MQDIMARKVYDPNENASPSTSDQSTDGNSQDVNQLETQSRELYTNFFREQISLNGLPLPDGVPMSVHSFPIFLIRNCMIKFHIGWQKELHSVIHYGSAQLRISGNWLQNLHALLSGNRLGKELIK